MRLAVRLNSLFRGLFRRRRMEEELDQELSSYLDELQAQKQRAGLPPEAARREALLEMGGLPHLKQEVRGSWLISAWDALVEDVRQAWRGLTRTRGLSTVAVLTFALGIGAVTAIVGVVNATLFTPPPYRDPARLVMVWVSLAKAGHVRAPLSGPELGDLRSRTTSFEGFGAIWANSVTLNDPADPEFVRIGLVTSDFFALLGTEPAVGRLFSGADETDGDPDTILLSWPLWQRRFGGDPAIAGRTITVNERPVRVVGVLSRAFRLRLPADAGLPDAVEAYQLLDRRTTEGPRGQRYLRVVGRMKPGVGLEEAAQDVNRLVGQLAREFPRYATRDILFRTVRLQDDNTREVRRPLWIVTGGVAVLLIISAVNVLGVLVARAAARRREMALRVALGAGLKRILRLALAEGLILALVGAAAGALIGRLTLSLLLAWRPEVLRNLTEAPIDGRVLVVTSGLALLWGALFALAPLREYARLDLGASLGAPGCGRGRRRPRVRSMLVVGQVALTAVLLIAAGLLTRTFARIVSIEPGFQAEGVLTFRMPTGTPRYPSIESQNELSRRIHAALGALPSVSGVGSVSHLPYDAIPNWAGPYAVEERSPGVLPNGDYRAVSPGFFAAAGLERLAGRLFSDADGPESPGVAVVDDLLARRVWPGESPLGKRLHVDPWSNGTPNTWVTVVGVVRHVRFRSLLEPLSEQVYFPLSQAPRNPVAYVVRTSADPVTLTPAVRQAIKEVDPRLPVYETLPLSAYVARARSLQRFTMVVVAAFAAVAVVLAAVGVYGVIAYLVVQRRREYGVRLALGATAGQIVGLVLSEGARLTGAGAAVGIAGSLLIGPLIRSQLFGVAPADPLTYSVAVPLLALSALLACWWPARRATNANVLDVLRAE
jgi:putative ABC transport system permease protein